MGRPKKKRQKHQQEEGYYPSSAAAHQAPVNAVARPPTVQSNEIDTPGSTPDLDLDELRRLYKESTVQELESSGKFAARRETAFETDYSLGDPISIYQSNLMYPEFCQRYNSERTKQTAKRSANVLDLFCGIGTGLVALKRLGIAIDEYHFADHDESARRVFKHNHCNPSVQIDLIHYIEYANYEEVEANIDDILLKNPIDIVIAGPPCQDFTRVNAYRQGVQGHTGNLLIKTMLLIKAIENHPRQKGQPVFAMVENVVLEFGDLKATEEAFGCSPVQLDAQYFSPCRRDRHYWINFPLRRFNFRGKDAKSTPDLEDGWMMLGDALKNDENGLNQDGEAYSKANTFMASKTRLDDHPRMSKVRKSGERFFRGTYSAQEREWMMGFPNGYVSSETEKSAKHLIGNAFSVPVVTFLLQPLKKLFARRGYYGYNLCGQNKKSLYLFKWQEENNP